MAGLLTTTEAMVAELPKKQSSAMPGGPGGMGGMGGMGRAPRFNNRLSLFETRPGCDRSKGLSEKTAD
jgi:hypothetical protein